MHGKLKKNNDDDVVVVVDNIKHNNAVGYPYKRTSSFASASSS